MLRPSLIKMEKFHVLPVWDFKVLDFGFTVFLLLPLNQSVDLLILMSIFHPQTTCI